ncbi:hypothetical protein JVU11DRAFT_4355 [Chiua virens]|nr:hypothetical protein JVU11DRAFT_4355 [Chiua virens]
MDHYTPLSQEAGGELEHECLLPLTDGNTLMEAQPRHSKTLLSPRWIGITVILLLFINVTCLLVTIHQLHLASRTLKHLLNYTDNRNLPRPDPYDGLY